MDNRPSRHDGILDHVAITLSGLCLVHCLLLPVIIVAIPLLGQFSETHFHAQMLIVVVPVSLFAFGLAYRRHGNKAVIACGTAGIAIMFVGGTVAHANFGVLADSLLTIAGSIILAASHYFNNRLAGHARAS
jgi:hypothetical protein